MKIRALINLNWKSTSEAYLNDCIALLHLCVLIKCLLVCKYVNIIFFFHILEGPTVESQINLVFSENEK